MADGEGGLVLVSDEMSAAIARLSARERSALPSVILEMLAVARTEAGRASRTFGQYRLDIRLLPLGTVRDAVAVVGLQELTTASAADQVSPAGLTTRERQVVRGLSRGASNLQIAHELQLSVHTVRRHVERVLRKLGVSRRAEVPARLASGVGESASEEPEREARSRPA
jgi:DNA-binding NarL/FixJ family response regulator